MSIAGMLRSIFTDENGIFIDENTPPPFYTYCGSGDRACLYVSTGNIQSPSKHACTGHLLFSLPQNSVLS
jgi:hypothetical protein